MEFHKVPIYVGLKELYLRWKVETVSKNILVTNTRTHLKKNLNLNHIDYTIYSVSLTRY